MFNAEEIRKLLTQTPFHPLRLFMSDGSVRDVLHPEMVIVTRNFLEVAQGVNEHGIAESIARLAIIHISRAEDLKQAA